MMSSASLKLQERCAESSAREAKSTRHESTLGVDSLAMGFLSSLLPGIRDIRAPLAAGYLWLAGLWLAFGDHINEVRPASTDSADRAWTYLGVPGQIGLVSFAAYVIGSASAELNLIDILKPLLGYPGTATTMKQFEVSTRQRVWESLWYTPPKVSPLVIRELVGWVRAWERQNRYEAYEHTGFVKLGDVRYSTWSLVRDALNEEDSGEGARVDQTSSSSSTPTDDPETIMIVCGLLDGLDSLRTQLLLKAPRLAAEIDRRQAEGEFRRAIGLPLVFVAVVGLITKGQFWWQIVAVVVVASLALRLFISGGRRLRASNDDIIRLMTNNAVISSPWLDDVARRQHQHPASPSPN
jgi:hypothetical protein